MAENFEALANFHRSCPLLGFGPVHQSVPRDLLIHSLLQAVDSKQAALCRCTTQNACSTIGPKSRPNPLLALITRSRGNSSERIDRAAQGESTIADENLAGDPTGLVEGQDRLGDVVGGTKPAEGGALRHPCQPPSVTGRRIRAWAYR